MNVLGHGKNAGVFRPVWTVVVTALLGVTFAFGCNMLSGLDSLQESAIADDEGGILADGGVVEVGESGVVGGPGTSNCTPDPDYCNTHCGNGTDNCGQARTCSNDCGQNSACDPTSHTCKCAVPSNYCDSRCHTSTDNCGKSEDCGECGSDGGIPQTCSAGGACGCDPDPVAKTCAGRTCGSAVNNCKQTVFCGVSGTSACASSANVCEADGSCCVPDNAAACNGKCNTTATNNCGQMISCPSTCSTGETCNGTSCCTPEALATTCGSSCAVTKTNNCGQTVSCGCGTGQVCTGGSCCTPQNYCVNNHQCGSGLNNCGQTVSCGSCIDECVNGGTCNSSTGLCTCRCGGVVQQSFGGLIPQLAPTCLPE